MRDNRITTAVGMLNGADLLLKEFNRRTEYSENGKATRYSLIIPLAIVCATGIEMALKSLLHKQGSDYGKTHDLLRLYSLVDSELQERVEEVSATLGVENVRGILRGHRNTLQEWRYREDHSAVVLDLRMAETLRAFIRVRNEKYGVDEAGAPSTEPPPHVDEKARQYLAKLKRP